MFKRVLTAAVVGLLLTSLAGCTPRGSSTGDTGATGDGAAAAQSTADATDDAATKSGDSKDSDPGGHFVTTITCDQLSALAPVFTAPMNESTVESYPGDDSLLCSWTNAASSDAYEETSTDIIIKVAYQDSYDKVVTSKVCAQDGIDGPPELEALGGCLKTDFISDPSAAMDRSATATATIPYWDVLISATCDETVTCIPDLPADFTPEAARAALVAIAQWLVAKS